MAPRPVVKGTLQKLGLSVALGLLFFGAASGAENPYRVLLDDPFPNASPPIELSPKSFRWNGIEGLPAGSTLVWDESSIQWSRIGERIVLPRARVMVTVPGADGVLVSTWDRITPLQRAENGNWTGEVVVPLVSGEASKLKVVLKRGNLEVTVPLSLERDGGGSKSEIGIDSSCSPWNLEIEFRNSPNANSPRSPFVVADCHIIRSTSTNGMPASLDVILLIDGAGSSLKMGGVSIAAEAPSVFRIRLFPRTLPIALQTADGGVYEIRYQIPKKLNRGFVGVGVGPYQYKLEAPGTSVDTATAVLTLYGSYQFSDSVRFTAFNATAIHKNYFTDTGFYFKNESLKILDQRVTIYVMLGANLIGYRFEAGTQKKWGAPQGFEALYRDFLSPNRSMVVGAFIYPPIDGKSYYNTWIRYGSPSVFGEINYLGIRDSFEGQSIYTRTVGFSVGFPLARFF